MTNLEISHEPARTNGLADTPPDGPLNVLVAGGAGYIGCVLIERLLDRGYNVRVLDRLYWGEGPLAHVRDRIELVVADVREMPDSAFEDIDGVINLSGLSNDPTAEYDPDANWQMNAIATEEMGKACVAHGINRLVFASSCSLYDGLPPGMWDETAPIEPRGAYATSKRYGEEALLKLAESSDLCPVILRNGTTTIGLFQGMFEKNIMTFNPGWDAACNTLDAFTDVRELQKRLRAAGVEPVTPADESSTGPASLVIVDPDGNAILLDQHV